MLESSRRWRLLVQADPVVVETRTSDQLLMEQDPVLHYAEPNTGSGLAGDGTDARAETSGDRGGDRASLEAPSIGSVGRSGSPISANPRHCPNRRERVAPSRRRLARPGKFGGSGGVLLA